MEGLVALWKFVESGEDIGRTYFSSKDAVNSSGQHFYRLAKKPVEDNCYIEVFPASDAQGSDEVPESVHLLFRQHRYDLARMVNEGSIPASQ